MRPGLIFRECNPGTSNIKPAVMNSWRVDYECFSSTGQSAASLKQSRRRTPPAQPRRPTRPVSAHFEIATFDVCSGTSSDRGQHLDAAIKNYPSPFPNLHPDRDLWPGRFGDRKIKGTRGEKKKNAQGNSARWYPRDLLQEMQPTKNARVSGIFDLCGIVTGLGVNAELQQEPTRTVAV